MFMFLLVMFANNTDQKTYVVFVFVMFFSEFRIELMGGVRPTMFGFSFLAS